MNTNSLEEVESYEERNYHKQTTFSEKVINLYEKVKFGAPLYFKSFLPIVTWLPRYNRSWLLRDLIAGMTISAMVIPESLAYAKLAHLPLQFGLYSSFVGTIIYAFLGTTREIAVGPASVLALLVGETILKVINENPELNFKPQEIAACLSFYSSFIALFLGITRLASVLDLIPEPVIVGFTTGAALTIILSQLTGLLGIPNVSKDGKTVEKIYQIVLNLANIRWLDIVFGLTSLAFICLLKFGTMPFLKKYPWLFYVKVGANGIAVVLFTIVSYLVSIYREGSDLHVVGEVPAGIKDAGVPNLDFKLLTSVSTQLIPIVLVMVLEHVSISRIFARKGKYQISASQELFAIGVCNLSASFLSAFPTTGSFTRSAVNYTSEIVTPLSGIVVGSVVIFAIYFLTPVFYYIPSATLSAIVVAAASTLIVDYKTVKELFNIRFFEGIILIVAAVLTFFVSAEVGILTAVGLSFLAMIYRIARPRVYLLNQVFGRIDAYIDHEHPRFKTVQPIPGVLIFRPQESLTFPNIDYVKNSIIDTTIELTDPGNRDESSNFYLWTDDIVIRSKNIREYRKKVYGKDSGNEPEVIEIPKLRGIILDFSAVNTMDASGIEGLIEIRDVLADYAGYFNILDLNKANTNALNFKGTDKDKIEIDEKDIEDGVSDLKKIEHRNSLFEMHFVSVHPKVANLLERAELTKQTDSHIDLEVFEALNHVSSIKTHKIDTSNHSKVGRSGSQNLNTSSLPKRSPRLFLADSAPITIKDKDTSSKRLSYISTIDPIAYKPSKFIHLTVADAVKRLKKRIDKMDVQMSSMFDIEDDSSSSLV